MSQSYSDAFYHNYQNFNFRIMGRNAKEKNDDKTNKDKPKAKGHRQKGAGTIITARPPRETNDGIILKSHEKLPYLLLQEFCQREKRPRPDYSRRRADEVDKYRFNVKLSDTKNSKNDLNFCPNVSCNSDKVAKDFAALLALFHFQKSLPLERKLPEPYSSTWKQMLSEHKAEENKNKEREKTKTKQSTTSNIISKPKVENSKVTTTASTSDSATINDVSKSRATTQQPQQQPQQQLQQQPQQQQQQQQQQRQEGSLANPMSIFAPSSAAATGRAVKSFLSQPTSSSSGSNSSSGNSIASKKLPPSAVSGLRSVHKHASRKESDKERQEKSAARKRKDAYFEGLRKANRPQQVMMSGRLRRQLEGALGIERLGNTGMDDDVVEYREALENLLLDIKQDIDTDADGIDANSGSSGGSFNLPLTPGEQANCCSEAAKQLLIKKFPSMATIQVLRGIYEQEGECQSVRARALQAASEVGTSLSDALCLALQEQAQQRLYLSLPEHLLPKELTGSGTLTVYKSGEDTDLKSTRTRLAVSQHAMLEMCSDKELELGRALRMEGYGWSTWECASAIHIVNSHPHWWLLSEGEVVDSKTNTVDEDIALTLTVKARAIALLIAATQASISTATSTSLSPLSVLDSLHLRRTVTGLQGAAEVEVEDGGQYTFWGLTDPPTEAETLEAIYETSFSMQGDYVQMQSQEETQCCVLCVSLTEGSFNEYALEVRCGAVSESSESSPSPSSDPRYLIFPPLLKSPVSHGNSSKEQDQNLSGQLYSSSEAEDGCRSKALIAAQVELCSHRVQTIEDSGECGAFHLVAHLSDVEYQTCYKKGPNMSKLLNILHSWMTASSVNIQSSGSNGSISEMTNTMNIENFQSLNQHSQQQKNGTSINHDTSTTSSNRNNHNNKNNKNNKQPIFWREEREAIRLPTPPDTMIKARGRLPAAKSRTEFVNLLGGASNQGFGKESHMVVTGETGCGKSTQIPTFILEGDLTAKIVVCQPRRLAAIGVASRVADELGSSIGDVVGYMVRGDSKCSTNTRLLFCTYGVLLRRLQEDCDLQGVTHVVLDEVHERGMESDFALALLTSAAERRNGNKNGNNKSKNGRPLSLILMSATIATDKFASYLAVQTNTHSVGKTSVKSYDSAAPVLSIPGRTFPVTEYFKYDYQDTVWELKSRREAAANSNYSHNHGMGGLNDEFGDSKDKNKMFVPAQDRIEYDLVTCLVEALVYGDGQDLDRSNEGMLTMAEGAILVFLPGVPEINRMAQALKAAFDATLASNYKRHNRKVDIFPLHGGLSANEQQKVFRIAAQDTIKIVLSTNVAEASVTIEDVTVVIDTCRVKEQRFDGDRGMSVLTTCFAAHDSLRQRMGRAGRVKAGRCFRMITDNTYQKLASESIPEMRRVPIDRLVLQCFAMLEGATRPLLACQNVLARCPDPPEIEAVKLAHRGLISLQALAPKSETEKGGITPLGKHLASMPCSPAIGRMLIFGAILGCPAPCAAVGAALSVRSPFQNTPPKDQDKRKGRDKVESVDKMKQHLAQRAGLLSDHLVLAQAVREWRECKHEHARRTYCRTHHLSVERMVEIGQLQQDLLEVLHSLGFLQSHGNQIGKRNGGGMNVSSVLKAALRIDPPSAVNAHALQPKVVAAAVTAGLYPSLVKVQKPPKRFIETHAGAIQRDAEATENKLFMKDSKMVLASSNEWREMRSLNMNSERDIDIDTQGMRRVFLHPSSVHFKTGTFSSNYLAFAETQATDTKAYIRDATEMSPYAALCFGGSLETSFNDGIVSIGDGITRFKATRAIVALIQALRNKLDELLQAKINDPYVQVDHSTPVVQAAVQLISSDGV